MSELSKCPKCGKSVKIYGKDKLREFTPEEGISIECDNPMCDFGLYISSTIKKIDYNIFEDMIKNAFNYMIKTSKNEI
jgi:PHP family Zn ribbon phosphoesterase